jgi:hypothetical protein
MEEDRMPKKKKKKKLEGTGRIGKPRKGCREEVERDLQVLGVRRWRDINNKEQLDASVCRHLFTAMSNSTCFGRYSAHPFQKLYLLPLV